MSCNHQNRFLHLRDELSVVTAATMELEGEVEATCSGRAGLLARHLSGELGMMNDFMEVITNDEPPSPLSVHIESLLGYIGSYEARWDGDAEGFVGADVPVHLRVLADRIDPGCKIFGRGDVAFSWTAEATPSAQAPIADGERVSCEAPETGDATPQCRDCTAAESGDLRMWQRISALAGRLHFLRSAYEDIGQRPWDGEGHDRTATAKSYARRLDRLHGAIGAFMNPRPLPPLTITIDDAEEPPTVVATLEAAWEEEAARWTIRNVPIELQLLVERIEPRLNIWSRGVEIFSWWSF